MLSRADIKKRAKDNFVAQYGISIAVFILFIVVGGAVSGATIGVAALLLMPPLYVGCSFFFLKIYKGQESDVNEFFSSGFSNYVRNLGGILWMQLFIFLWSLLFIIPGIIKAIAYSMTPYILADYPNVSATNALKISMEMTDGYKGEIFVMMLSFLGWLILSALTAGILYILYVGPYMQASMAGMYEELKKNVLQRGKISESQLI